MQSLVFSTPELEEIFINLDLSQLELRSEEESKGTQDDIWDLLRRAKKRTNLRLILAPGGRGKTTLLRHLAYNYALKQPKQNAPVLIPVFLRLRRWQEVITTTEGLDLPTLIERHLKQDISGSSLLGMIRSGGINRLNSYPARDLID
jgi:predicted NACHT family NTPase